MAWFSESGKPIVLERRKMEEVVAICLQLRTFQQQQKIVKTLPFAPRLDTHGSVRAWLQSSTTASDA
jgi:hypothetical protein